MATRGTDELHQVLIRDHFRRPRNRGAPEGDAHEGRAHNRFCGDTIVVWARVEEGRIAELRFDGRGCAISLAAASMLTGVARGKDAGEIAALRQRFMAGLGPEAAPLGKELGDLRALAGVRRFPSRVRCAVLPFDALEDALGSGEGDAGPGTTSGEPGDPRRVRA